MSYPNASLTEDLFPLIPDGVFEVIAFINQDGLLQKIILDDLNVLTRPPNEFIGKSVFDLAPPDLAQSGRLNFTQALKSGRSQSFIYQQSLGTNERFYEINLAVNGPNEVLAIIRDVTGRKKAEKELLQLNRAFLSLQAASTSIVASLELDHVLDTFAWEITNLLNGAGCIVSQWNKEDDSVSVLVAYPHRDLVKDSFPKWNLFLVTISIN